MDTFIANFLDPCLGINFEQILFGFEQQEEKGLWYKEEIVPRNEEEKKYYLSKIDKETNELYFFIKYENGKKEVYCCDKHYFFKLYNIMKNL